MQLLLLGSLPGAMSLAQERYYAHPRNQFWRLMSAVTGHDLVALSYQDRLEALLAARIGLWDTVAAARRSGSLDADIRLEQASDLDGLIGQAPALRAIGFNGATAARIGRSRIGQNRIMENIRGIDLVDLPSSSPAYTLAYDRKLERWRSLRDYL